MNTHIGIFKKMVYRKVKVYTNEKLKSYTPFDKYDDILYHEEFVKTEEFYRCEIPNPILQMHDKIYLSELDETVRINDIVRTTTNEVIYTTGFKDVIEDEISNENFNTQNNKTLKKKWYQFYK